MLQYDRVWSSPLICNDETGLTVVAERKFEAAGVAFTVDQCVADQGIVYNSLTITNPNIDNNEKENFRIYFTAADSE